MRISEFKGEKALDLLAEIIEPAAAIFADEAVTNAFKKDTEENKKGIPALAAHIFKNHKAETLEILAALNNVSVDKYNANPIMIIAQLMTVLQDTMSQDVLAVFTSQAQETEDEKSSGAATENTQADPA